MVQKKHYHPIYHSKEIDEKASAYKLTQSLGETSVLYRKKYLPRNILVYKLSFYHKDSR